MTEPAIQPRCATGECRMSGSRAPNRSLARWSTTYLAGRARVVNANGPRVFLNLGDHLGSNAVTIDLGTGELVQRSTSMAYGAQDSSYRPGKWDSFRSEYRFTGKEDDIELGLVYFGKRYYAPMLGQHRSVRRGVRYGLSTTNSIAANRRLAPFRDDSDPALRLHLPTSPTGTSGIVMQWLAATEIFRSRASAVF